VQVREVLPLDVEALVAQEYQLNHPHKTERDTHHVLVEDVLGLVGVRLIAAVTQYSLDLVVLLDACVGVDVVVWPDLIVLKLLKVVKLLGVVWNLTPAAGQANGVRRADLLLL
jgi:hypothetical protein